MRNGHKIVISGTVSRVEDGSPDDEYPRRVIHLGSEQFEVPNEKFGAEVFAGQAISLHYFWEGNRRLGKLLEIEHGEAPDA